MPKKNEGFSILEVLIVVFLIALTAGLGVAMVGRTTSSKLKHDSTQLRQTIQFAYNDALARQTTLRLVFDFNEKSYWLEEGGESILVEPADPLKKKKEKKKEEITKTEDKEATDAEGSFSVVEEGPIKKTELSPDIHFRDIFVAHQEELQSEGQSYLYFFPRGLTEYAVIHLSDEEDGEDVRAIVVNPITGRSAIKDQYVEFETPQEK